MYLEAMMNGMVRIFRKDGLQHMDVDVDEAAFTFGPKHPDVVKARGFREALVKEKIASLEEEIKKLREKL